MTDHIEDNQSMREVPEPNRLPDYEIIRTERFRPKFAGFWTRFWAYIIDLLIVSSISGIFIKPVFRVLDIKISNPSFLLFSPYKVTLLILFLAYFALMTKLHRSDGRKNDIGHKSRQTRRRKTDMGNNPFQGSDWSFHFKTSDDPLSARCLHAEKGSVARPFRGHVCHP